jgi:hypothetical protein
MGNLNTKKKLEKEIINNLTQINNEINNTITLLIEKHKDKFQDSTVQISQNIHPPLEYLHMGETCNEYESINTIKYISNDSKYMCKIDILCKKYIFVTNNIILQKYFLHPDDNGKNIVRIVMNIYKQRIKKHEIESDHIYFSDNSDYMINSEGIFDENKLSDNTIDIIEKYILYIKEIPNRYDSLIQSRGYVII